VYWFRIGFNVSAVGLNRMLYINIAREPSRTFICYLPSKGKVRVSWVENDYAASFIRRSASSTAEAQSSA